MIYPRVKLKGPRQEFACLGRTVGGDLLVVESDLMDRSDRYEYVQQVPVSDVTSQSLASLASSE